MAITKEQWKDIEYEMLSPFGSVSLFIDGYEVTLAVRPNGPRKFAILPYVNGFFKGAYLRLDSEEGRRFYRPVTRHVLSLKQRQELIKVYGGKRCPKADLERINKTFKGIQANWTSVKALRLHYEKQNKDLQLVKIGIGTLS